MKHYRLLKDTPTIKAGTIFEERVSDFDQLKELVRITPIGAKTSPQWTIKDINNFDEWFEEVKELEGWKPEYNDKFKYISERGSVCDSVYYDRDIDLHLLLIGNCYPLDTPEELIIREQKLIPQALRRLKIAAKKAWFEFDGSEGADWRNSEQVKYYIYYDHTSACREFDVDHVSVYQDLGQIYFPTEKSAQAVIDDMQDDLKLLLGVK